MFGLLGPETEDTLLGPLERKRLQQESLLGLGAGLLAQRGNRNFGEALGVSLLNNQGDMQRRAAEARREAVMRQALTQQQAAQKAEAERQAQLGQAVSGLHAPGSPLARIAALDPKLGIDLLPKPQEAPRPMVVGGALVDPSTGQPIYTAPREPEKPLTQVVDGVLYERIGGKWEPQTEKAADPKLAAETAKRDSKLAQQAASAANTLEVIKEARSIVANEMGTTGLAGQLLSNVGGTDAKALQAKLETVKANLGFDRLQEMRDNSPTGGALGQVAVQELVALQATVASLDQAQAAGRLDDALARVEQHYTRWLDTVKQAQMGGQNDLIPKGATADALNAALAKYGRGR